MQLTHYMHHQLKTVYCSIVWYNVLRVRKIYFTLFYFVSYDSNSMIVANVYRNFWYIRRVYFTYFFSHLTHLRIFNITKRINILLLTRRYSCKRFHLSYCILFHTRIFYHTANIWFHLFMNSVLIYQFYVLEALALQPQPYFLQQLYRYLLLI